MGKRRSGHARECRPRTDTQKKRALEYKARKETQNLKGSGGTAQQWVRDDNTQRAVIARPEEKVPETRTATPEVDMRNANQTYRTGVVLWSKLFKREDTSVDMIGAWVFQGYRGQILWNGYKLDFCMKEWEFKSFGRLADGQTVTFDLVQSRRKSVKEYEAKCVRPTNIVSES